MTTPAPLSSGFAAPLPGWLVEEVPSLPRALPTRVDRARFVTELSDRNWREGNGGPFAAVVVDHQTGELHSVGVNVVLSSNLSCAHAEMMAIGLAQERAGTWNLAAVGDFELVVNWRPCAMCYGALIWSGIRHLVLAGAGPECEALTGFDEGPMPPQWAAELENRGITVTVDVNRDAAIAVFSDYGKSGATVYNARR